MEKQKFSRLPELARPLLYDIYLKPNLESFEFHGTETISLEVIQPTDFFTLHANQVVVESASIKFSDGTTAEISKDNVITDEKNMLLTVKLPKQVKAQDKVDLGFKYIGELNNNMNGFYRSVYKDSNGEPKYMASTQFESTDARKAFLCWDEPTYKAKFDVTLEVSAELTALSNMHVLQEQKTNEGTKIVKFATTPLMSTYLVAFAVGDFDSIHGKTKTGIDIGIYYVNNPGRSGNSQFALEVAIKAMDWYTDWFNISMPLSKCDLLAIPDFAAGAMENWGLITFREKILIHDEQKSSDRVKSYSALVIAHEIAHFWFGDLVTMKWWTDLWLKEGFATFMEFVFVGYAYPEYKSWLNFVSEDLTSGLSLDSLRNSHPIEVPIENPNELHEIYDSISYSKASSVNRMLYYYLGESVFQQGLRVYLKNFQFSNAETRDLWNSLSEVSGQNIESMMNSWTRQMGFPLVTVEQRRLEGERRELLLKQRRYLADGQPDNSGSLWEIPIGIAKGTSPNEVTNKILFRDANGSFTLDGIKSDEWIKLNAGTTGFFRVNYSDEMFQQLLPAFYSGKMGVIDRFSFASDLFALVMSGEASITRFLTLLDGCGGENEYIIWQAMDSGISEISNVLDYIGDGKTLRDRFCAFAIKNLLPLAEKLTWVPKENEDMHTRLLRQLVFGRLIKLGHGPSIQAANSLFREYIDKKTELDANLRPIIFSSVTRMNDPKAIEELRVIYETINFNEVETNCLSALGQICDATLLDNIYKYAIVEDNVRNQDLMYLFFGSATTKLGKALIWEYFKQHLPKIICKYGSVDSNIFQHILKETVRNYCTKEMAIEIEDFFKKSLDKEQQKLLNRTILQSLESIRLKERLMKSTEEVLADFLAANGF